MKYSMLILVLLLSSPVLGQGLFEDAVEGEDDQLFLSGQQFELNGYVRGVGYWGVVPEKNDAETKSVYGEASLKFRVRKQEFGNAFAELRFRRGYEFGERLEEFSLREGYVDTYLGDFDFRIGQQIVVWGRADGFNPTDNITPKNMLVRSPDEDDRREGNFLFRAHYNFASFRLEGIWVPVYAASVLPSKIMPLPEGITLGEQRLPSADFRKGATAIRLNAELASFDGSISYFNGYNPFPGVEASSPEFTAIGVALNVFPTAYRTHAIGADFSTTLSSFGLRGEFTYKKPYLDYKRYRFVPNPDLQYILGGDKEFGDLSVIVQYVGRYVFDFKDLQNPVSPLDEVDYEIIKINRMLTAQQHEISHSISFRPALVLMHETLNLEVLGLYNITTEELLLRPKISYDLADALTLTLGGELYSGPDETLYGNVDEALSALYLEIRASF